MKFIDTKNLKDFNKVNIKNWESVKNNIYIRYISKGNIDDYGKDIIYIEKMDLALAVSLQEVNKERVTLSYLLTNKDIKTMKQSADAIFEQAKYNLENDRRMRVYSVPEYMLMDNLFFPIVKRDLNGYISFSSGQNKMPGIIYDYDVEKEIYNCLVVTSSKGCFGAGYSFTRTCISEVLEKFDYENFYMIPLSINAMLCVRENFITNDGDKIKEHIEDDLIDMLYKSNEILQDYKNILSYRIYYYDYSDGGLIFPIKNRFI